MLDRSPHNSLNHKNLKSETGFNEKFFPARLIFQATPGGPSKSEALKPSVAPATTSPEIPKPAIPDATKPDTTKEKAEVKDVSADAKKVVEDNMETQLRLANISLKAVEVQLSPKTSEYLRKYFNSSIDRFDTDKDGKIDKEEAENYKKAMFAKTSALIMEHLPTKEHKEATEAKNAAAAAIEAPEISKKNIDDIKDISDSLDLETSKAAFETLQTQNSSYQSSVSASISAISGFHAQVATFQKASQGWKAFSHFGDEVWSAVTLSTSDGAKEEMRLTGLISVAKVEGQVKLRELTAKKLILDSNSEKIKAAIAAERKKTIAERDGKVAEIKDNASKIDEAKAEKTKKYAQIKAKQDELIKKQEALKDKKEKQEKFKADWNSTKQKEQLETKQKAFEDSGKDTTAELEALTIILDDPHLPPEAKVKIKAEYDEVEARHKSGETNLRIVTDSIKTGKIVDRKLSADEKVNLEQLTSVEGFLKGQIDPAMTSMGTTIARLEELKLQYATAAPEVEAYYNKKVESMDKVNEAISDYTLASSIGRDKSITSLESAVKSLDSLNVKNSGFIKTVLFAPLNLPQGYFVGIAGFLEDGAAWMRKTAGSNIDETTGIFRKVNQVLAIPSGLAAGAMDFGGGILTMAAHPWDSVKGLTSLVGIDAEKGTWTTETLKATWKHLGSSLVDGTEWNKGHYGTSVGVTLFNVLSMFTGAGEVKALGEAGMVGRAAATASKARVAKVAQAVAKGASESWTLGRGAQILEFTKTLAIEATPKFFKEARKAGKEATTVMGKTGAVFKSLGGSIIEGTPKIIKDTFGAVKSSWNKGKLAAEAGKSRVWAMTKSLGGSVIRTTGKAIVKTAEIYKDLLLSPFEIGLGAPSVSLRFSKWAYNKTGNVLSGAGKFVGKVWEFPRGGYLSKVRNIGRASKLSEAGRVATAEAANFAKAREAIADIISKDPELSMLAEGGGATSAEGKAANAKAAEAKASIELSRRDPKLFDSYVRMEKAVAEIEEHSGEIVKDLEANINKVKKNKEVVYEVAEYKKLKEQKAAAEAKVAGSPTPSPALEAELAEAEKSLKDFEGNSKRMGKVEEHSAAIEAETGLTTLKAERKALTDKYIGTSKEPLAKLEREVGEARAAESNDITADKGTPEYTDSALHDFEEAVKTGRIEEIEKATNAFGTYQADSELGKMLDAIHHKISGKTPKVGFVDAEVSQFSTPFEKALKEGDMEQIATIKKDPAAAKYAEHFEYLEYKYYSETADLHTVFRRHQNNLIADYELYNKAIQYDTSIADVEATKLNLRKKNPSWAEAFDELDARQNFIRHNDVITHGIAALRMKVELPNIIKPGMKAEEAVLRIRNRYKGEPMGASDIVGGRPAGEFVLGEGANAKTYKVYLENEGKITVRDPAGEIVKTLEEVKADARAAATPTAAPSAAPTRPVFEADTAITHLDETTLAAQQEGKTVAYGTGSPTGDWLEITKVGLDEHLIVEVKGGVLNKEVKVKGLKLEKHGSEYIFEGTDHAGVAYEYRNVKEVFNPATNAEYASKAVIEATPTVTPTTAPTAAPSATPAAAPTATPPKKPSTIRRDEAIEKLGESEAKLEANRRALRDHEKNLKLGQDTYNLREGSGKYSAKDLERLQAKIDAAKELVKKTKSEITQLEEAVSGYSKEKWAARGAVALDKAGDFITSPLRSKWFEKTVERLQKAKGLPREIGTALATFLKEQNLAAKGKLKLLCETGLNIASVIKESLTKFPEGTLPFGQILNDQIKILGLLSKSVSKNLEKSLALPEEKKIALLEEEWKKLALHSGTVPPEDMYTDADLDYLKDKKDLLRNAVDGARDQEGITAASLTAVINEKLGPEGNDSNKAYTMNFDGITVEVDKDGHRTYKGLEEWVTDIPDKKLIDSTFKAVSKEYNFIDPKSVLKLNNNKPFANVEELSKQVKEKLTAQILEKMKGMDYSKGLTIFSTERASDELPNYVARISETGKVTIDINPKWTQRIFDQSKGIIKPPARTPDTDTELPKVETKTSSTPGLKKSPKKASPESDTDESSESAKDSASIADFDATATFAKPVLDDPFPD